MEIITREAKLTKPYELLFEELTRDIYHTWSVYDYFIRQSIRPKEKINVILRIDVDFGLHLCSKLASILKEKEINASFYFLTFPSRYYNIWRSDIPKIVSDMSFEVGLHTDHYYEQLISGRDATEGIKEDVKKLSKLVGKPIYGMVYHGHEAMKALGTLNWEIYKNTPPEELDLLYHDGLTSPYTKPGSNDFWEPNTDHPLLSDHMRGVVGAWRYCVSLPLRILRKVKVGESIHICIHPHNAFEWWENWDYSYGEEMPEKKDTLTDELINIYNVRLTRMIQYLKSYPRMRRILERVKKWRKSLT